MSLPLMAGGLKSSQTACRYGEGPKSRSTGRWSAPSSATGVRDPGPMRGQRWHFNKFSYHAGLCSAGGERTLRHTARRDLLQCSWVDRAGLQPEREKPQVLLPQRPEDHGLDRRRPADIFVPSYLGAPLAFDLAVTGPQRLETLAEASRKSLAAATSYAAVKKAHLDTAATCQSQGVRFLPLVAETTGAWEADAAKVLTHISRAAAAREGADPAALHGELLQELCVVARSFRARAVLHRRAELAAAPSTAESAAACLLAARS